MPATVQTRVFDRIRRKPGQVFTTKDFLDLGSREAADQSLSRLVRADRVKRLGRGLYYLPRTNLRLGIPLPPDTDAIAGAIARQTGSRVAPSGAVAANRLGLSTQVPAKPVYLTDGTSREVKVGKLVFTVRHVAPKELPLGSPTSIQVFQAIRYLGPAGVDDGVVRRLRAVLSKTQKNELRRDAQYTTGWIGNVVRRIAGPDAEARRMDDIARLPADDRRDLFAATAERRALVAAVIEKDFWVCWTLKRVFALPDPPAHLIFKGGTSLSKVFGAIERFSEDVDLSFDRADLGFGVGKDPLTAPSRKKRQEWVKELAVACQAVIRDRFLPQLAAAFADALGAPADSGWSVELDPADPDQQTVLFHYPATDPPAGDEPAYLRPAVRLEIGARSDHWPSTDAVVTPYAAEEFPAQFIEPKAAVRVLGADRTFWEKATILHLWHHAPADKPFRDRQSRHYYDLVRLYEKGIGPAAIADAALLLAVAEHKNTFFPSTWAKYEEAKPGSLRLVPPDARLPELEADYRKMREMFFSEPPPFERIIAALRAIEARINMSA